MALTKIIKFQNQTYLVNPIKIHKVSYEIGEADTKVYVKYINNRYSEYALTIPNTDKNKINYELLSDVYISIMTLNYELIKAI